MLSRRFLLLATPGLLAGCAALAPRSVSISEARLAQVLSEQFPFNSRLLEVFDITLNAPQVRLLPAENRIGTRFNYSLGGFLLGTRAYQGQLELSYGLRYEPSDASVRLTQVRVEDFEVPGVPAAFASRASRLGALLAEQLLHDFTLYRLSPEDLRLAQGRGLQPGQLRVVPGALQLELLPR